MSTSRIEMLEKFMKEDATDPFPVYALALEYQQVDKLKAQHLFETLLTRFPDYLPTYYMAGNFFLDENETIKAEEIFRQGLQLAQQQQNKTALREIRSALDNLTDD